jgi:uncharacterized protein YndB with AHSA1/START domain
MTQYVTLPAPLARWFTAAGSCASTDTGRVALTGVYVETGEHDHPILGTYAGVQITVTDSYRLATVGIPATETPADEHNGAAGFAQYCGTGRVLIPAAAVKLPARSPLSLSWDTDTDDNGTPTAAPVTVTTTAKGAQTVTTVEAIPAAFPNYRNLIPTDNIGDIDPGAYNPRLLGGMMTAFGKACGDNDTVRMIGGRENKPFRVDIVGDGYAAAALIMPVRVDGGPLSHLAAATDTAAAAGGAQ